MAPSLQQLLPMQQDALKGECSTSAWDRRHRPSSEVTGLKVMVSVPCDRHQAGGRGAGRPGPSRAFRWSACQHPSPATSRAPRCADAGRQRPRNFAEQCWHHMPQGQEVRRRFNFSQIHANLRDHGPPPISLAGGGHAQFDDRAVDAVECCRAVPQEHPGQDPGRAQRRGNLVAFVQNRFTFGDKTAGFSGFFMMMPDPESLYKMLRDPESGRLRLRLCRASHSRIIHDAAVFRRAR